MAQLQRRPGGIGRKSNVFSFHAYHFRANEQDPIIDRMQTIMEDELGSGKGRFTRVHEEGGPTVGTLSNWFTKRRTRMPKYASAAAFLHALGYDLAIVKVPGGNKANGKAWDARMPKIIQR